MFPFAWAWSDLQTLIGYGSGSIFNRTYVPPNAPLETFVAQRVDAARQIIIACEKVIATSDGAISPEGQNWLNQVLELNHKSDTAQATGS